MPEDSPPLSPSLPPSPISACPCVCAQFAQTPKSKRTNGRAHAASHRPQVQLGAVLVRVFRRPVAQPQPRRPVRPRGTYLPRGAAGYKPYCGVPVLWRFVAEGREGLDIKTVAPSPSAWTHHAASVRLSRAHEPYGSAARWSSTRRRCRARDFGHDRTAHSHPHAEHAPTRTIARARTHARGQCRASTGCRGGSGETAAGIAPPVCPTPTPPPPYSEY